jgi:SHS2 domain-containing protein
MVLMAGAAGSGYRLAPHTADLVIEAWAPTRDRCLEEAARGLVASFADVTGTIAERTVRSVGTARTDTEILVWLLEEVIYLLDTQDAVSISTVVKRAADGSVAGEFEVVDRTAVQPVGATPKAVTRHGLGFGEQAGVWRCTVTIDV